MPSSVIGLLVVASLAITVVVDLRILRAQPEDIRQFGKPVWYLITLVPVIGAVAWIMLGRPHYVAPGKRVAKDRERRGKRQKLTPDRQMIVDRLTSDVRTREARSSALTAASPGSPGSLTARAARSAASAMERSATSPATASYRDE